LLFHYFARSQFAVVIEINGLVVLAFVPGHSRFRFERTGFQAAIFIKVSQSIAFASNAVRLIDILELAGHKRSVVMKDNVGAVITDGRAGGVDIKTG
jgi:hypothetical protein